MTKLKNLPITNSVSLLVKVVSSLAGAQDVAAAAAVVGVILMSW